MMYMISFMICENIVLLCQKIIVLMGRRALEWCILHHCHIKIREVISIYVNPTVHANSEKWRKTGICRLIPSCQIDRQFFQNRKILERLRTDFSVMIAYVKSICYFLCACPRKGNSRLQRHAGSAVSGAGPAS